jgi:hypothetical protein
MDTYHETRLEGKRVFTLTDDGVQVSADIVMGSSYETLVKYDQLDPAITVIRQHHKLFPSSIIGIPLFAITTFVFVNSFNFSLLDFLPGLFAGLTLLSIFIAMITRKRVEYARFCSISGVPLLDIARAGPDKDNFDGYVKEIRTRIAARQHARQPNGEREPPMSRVLES